VIDPETFVSEYDDVFESVLGWGIELGEHDSPATIPEWTSLAQVRLVHELETRFSVRLPDAALLEPQTYASLRRLVRDAAS